MAARDDATITKWTKKKEKAEMEDRDAVRGMKDKLAEAMRDPDTHRNIAQELLNARRGGAKSQHREGFGDDGEIITGWYEDRPWERE